MRHKESNQNKSMLSAQLQKPETVDVAYIDIKQQQVTDQAAKILRHFWTTFAKK